MQTTFTTDGGLPGGGVGVADGFTVGVGLDVDVAPGAGNFTVTACDPDVHIVTLHAVDPMVTTVSDANDVANVVAPGAAGAVTPFTVQLVVV